MSNALYDSLQVEFSCGDYTLKSSGKAIIFEGFTKVYKPADEEKSGINIPNLVEGELADLVNINKEQKFTKPPISNGIDIVIRGDNIQEKLSRVDSNPVNISINVFIEPLSTSEEANSCHTPFKVFILPV